MCTSERSGGVRGHGCRALWALLRRTRTRRRGRGRRWFVARLRPLFRCGRRRRVGRTSSARADRGPSCHRRGRPGAIEADEAGGPSRASAPRMLEIWPDSFIYGRWPSPLYMRSSAAATSTSRSSTPSTSARCRLSRYSQKTRRLWKSGDRASPRERGPSCSAWRCAINHLNKGPRSSGLWEAGFLGTCVLGGPRRDLRVLPPGRRSLVFWSSRRRSGPSCYSRRRPLRGNAWAWTVLW